MARPRNYGAGSTVLTNLAPTSPRLIGTCPDCGAGPGTRCFRITSWVVERVPLRGFYTERTSTVHTARRPARPAADPAAPPTKESLRREIRSLTMHKAGGSERVHIRRWAGSVQRTIDELAAK